MSLDLAFSLTLCIENKIKACLSSTYTKRIFKCLEMSIFMKILVVRIYTHRGYRDIRLKGRANFSYQIQGCDSKLDGKFENLRAFSWTNF